MCNACVYISSDTAATTCLSMYLCLSASFFPCTMRPVYSHQHTFAYSKIHTNTLPCLSASVHTHSQAVIYKYNYRNSLHKSASMHTFVMISWLERIFPIHSSSLRQPRAMQQHRVAFGVFCGNRKQTAAKYTFGVHIYLEKWISVWFSAVCACVLNEIMCAHTHIDWYTHTHAHTNSNDFGIQIQMYSCSHRHTRTHKFCVCYRLSLFTGGMK